MNPNILIKLDVDLVFLPEVCKSLKLEKSEHALAREEVERLVQAQQEVEVELQRTRANQQIQIRDNIKWILTDYKNVWKYSKQYVYW